MHDRIHHHFAPAVRRFVVWCLLVAVPVFGVSGTLVELLGPNHVHRVVAGAGAAALDDAADADPMRGWVDLRREGLTTVSHRHPHSHSHALFARHHHDRDDASVIALDGALAQAETADDGGAGGAGSSFSHVMALTEPASFALPSVFRFAWHDAAAAAAMPWTADGPMRPPRA